VISNLGARAAALMEPYEKPKEEPEAPVPPETTPAPAQDQAMTVRPPGRWSVRPW